MISEALRGGAQAIQIREKSLSPRDLLALVDPIRSETRRHGALLFINDRVDLALAAGADGVHLGPEDISVAAARKSPAAITGARLP